MQLFPFRFWMLPDISYFKLLAIFVGCAIFTERNYCIPCYIYFPLRPLCNKQ